jgi:hypothetical protein
MEMGVREVQRGGASVQLIKHAGKHGTVQPMRPVVSTTAIIKRTVANDDLVIEPTATGRH